MKELEILHEDADILIVNKPSGMASVPEGYSSDQPDLVAMLEPGFGRVWVVHRLDKETSGAIVFARNEETHRNLSMQFEQRDVNKVYHALVVGQPDWTERKVLVPLVIDGDRHHRTLPDPDKGKPAVTQFNLLQRIRKYALLEARPETGRTHQIRAHAKFMALPIVCDTLYGDGEPIYLSTFKKGYRAKGDREERALIERLALHAFQLEIVHPSTGERVQFEAPYPKDLRATISQLGKT